MKEGNNLPSRAILARPESKEFTTRRIQARDKIQVPICKYLVSILGMQGYPRQAGRYDKGLVGDLYLCNEAVGLTRYHKRFKMTVETCL